MKEVKSSKKLFSVFPDISKEQWKEKTLADLKGALSGFGCVILPFLVLNLVGLISGFASEKYFPFMASSLGVIYSLFILALIMALIGFILVYLLSATYFRVKYRRLLKPF